MKQSEITKALKEVITKEDYYEALGTILKRADVAAIKLFRQGRCHCHTADVIRQFYNELDKGLIDWEKEG